LSERVLSLIETVPNPFVQVRVDSAWEALTYDVPTINESAFRLCRRLIDDVRRSRQSHGLLLSGLPGAGKTHLLARLRHTLYQEQQGAFVYVYPVTAPDRFNRHVLHALAGDMLRQPPENLNLSQIEIAIARLLDPDLTTLDTVAHFWDGLRAHSASGPELLSHLEQATTSVSDALDLNHDVLMAAIRYVARVNRTEARAWLLGRPVTEEQAAALGVAGTLDDEALAADALFTLARLAGERTTLVLAFDQIEGLQTEHSDITPLVAWGHGVTNLIAQTHNVGVITCAQVSYLETLRSALGEALYDGRIAERQASLQPLNPAEAQALTLGRLTRSEEVQAVRLAHRQWLASADTTDDFWPLNRTEIETLAARPEISARKLLLDCRQLFEERRAQLLRQRKETPPPKSAETLADSWEEAFAQERERALDKIDEGIYVDGLLRVIELQRDDAVRAERSKTRDIDLELVTSSGRTAIAVCHSENMKSLAARLHRLNDLARLAAFERLVLLRDQRLPISPRATKTREYLADLARQGVVVLNPTAETYAALAALRRLLAESAAGDLTLDGRAVPPEELKHWLAQNTPAAVQELVERVATGRATDRGGDLERLQSALREGWLMELPDAARAAQMPADWARLLANRHPTVIGYIEGTPELLFMHPEAMDRS
jgi:hypothetical protein